MEFLSVKCKIGLSQQLDANPFWECWERVKKEGY